MRNFPVRIYQVFVPNMKEIKEEIRRASYSEIYDVRGRFVTEVAEMM